MTQPASWSPSIAYATYAAANANAPFPPASLDLDFGNLKATLATVLANLALIQRDDGDLQMAIVEPDSLSDATLNLIGDWAPKGPWLPSQNYAVRDMVTIGLITSYVCATAHTSSSFALDLAAGYWQPVNATGSAAPTTITFTSTDRVLGRSSAGAGAGEEIICTSFARSLMDDATAAAALVTLGIGTTSDPTFNNTTVASLLVTGLAASSFVYSDASKKLATTTAPTNGQLLIGSTGAVPVAAALTGTANQVTVTNGAGSITLALPQNIHTAATPTFANASLTNHSTGAIPYIGASSAITTDLSNFYWDATNKRLGIGMGAPLYALDVVGVGRIKGPALNQVGRLILEPGNAATPTAELQINALGMFIGQYNGTDIIGYNTTSFMVRTDAAIGFTNGDINSGTLDTTMYRDAADIFAQRRGVNAQAFRVYNTYTSATNLERAVVRWNANVFEVGTEKGSGGGTARALALVTDLTQRWTVGATTGHLLAATDNTYDIGASAATRPRDLYLGGKVKNYNALPTAGWGLAMIGAAGRATAQAAANASVASYALPAADGTYEVSANVLVTTATNHNFTVTCAYTDEGNTARTLTLSFTLVAGGALVTAVVNANGTVPYMGIPQHIRCKASTSITIATTGVFTTVAYNVEGVIKQTA